MVVFPTSNRMGMLHVLFMSYFTCVIPMFRISAMKAFISTLVTAFHLWKRLFGHKLPCCSTVAICSVAYLHVEFSKAITGEVCSTFPILTCLSPPPTTQLCRLQRTVQKKSPGVASADKGIRKPGWAVNGNATGGISEAFSMAVHSKAV